MTKKAPRRVVLGDRLFSFYGIVFSGKEEIRNPWKPVEGKVFRLVAEILED